jgi:hypothetical protein
VRRRASVIRRPGADDVAGADFLDPAAAWLVEAAAFGDVEGLPDGESAMRCGPRGESDGADTDV